MGCNGSQAAQASSPPSQPLNPVCPSQQANTAQPSSPSNSQPNLFSPRQPHFNVRHSSQDRFGDTNQTAIVFDFDDTLFPTTFVDALSASFQKKSLGQAELKDFLATIEECQVSAESLLHCAQNLGHVIIVTLCTRSLLKKRCETWYPRVWQLMNGGMSNHETNVMYARECQVHKDQTQNLSNGELSTGHWAWVKGTVIEQELHRFYSQYQGQSWKNVISIGDSNIERYGTLGASHSYVKKRFGGTSDEQNTAYVKMWEQFDNNDPKWKQSLEGEHNGHVFKVRTKVIKLLDSPTPAQLCHQQNLLWEHLPSIVGFDGCLNLLIDELREAQTQHKLESAQIDDTEAIELSITARAGSDSLAFTSSVEAAPDAPPVDYILPPDAAAPNLPSKTRYREM